MSYRVSVVVPTYKRPALLQRCLYALLAQDLAPEDYEMIIVDDANCSETRQQVEHWIASAQLSGHTLSYLPVPANAPHGPAAARNKGWRMARGEIIAFTDDDCIPLPDWLSKGVSAFSQNIMAVSGRVLVPLSDIPTDYEQDAAHLEHGEFVTANSFYRRDALLQVGGFDERFTTAWREDSDLYFSLLAHNMACITHPEAKVLHFVRPAPWGVSIKQQRKSMFNALVYKKHPVLYRQRLQAMPPWHYYMIVLGLLTGFTGILRKSTVLMLSGFGLWSSLTARFCLRRLHTTSHAPAHVMEMIITSLLIPPLAIFWRIVGMFRFRVPFL